jgi:hypothetical protein
LPRPLRGGMLRLRSVSRQASLISGRGALCVSTARRGSSVKVALCGRLSTLDVELHERLGRAAVAGLSQRAAVTDDVLLGKARRSRTRQGRMWKR